MKAFWWFKEGAIAGMARPGFNGTRWFDLPFQEAVLLGWIGQFGSGKRSYKEFFDHLQDYGRRVAVYYKIENDELEEVLHNLAAPEVVNETMISFRRRTKIISNHSTSSEFIEFEFSRDRLLWEIDQLKAQKIDVIVSLTELHHGKDDLENSFETYHLAINDLDAPKREQVHQLAEIFCRAKADNQRVAIHCLAGIGRTSTMIIAAHLNMGESLDSLKQAVFRQNPAFILTGPQSDFIHGMAE